MSRIVVGGPLQPTRQSVAVVTIDGEEVGRVRRVTSPAVPHTDPTNVTGKRIGAWVIDLIIYFVFSMVLTFAMGGGPEVVSEEFPNSAAAAAYCEGWELNNNGFCVHTGDSTQGTVLAVESSIASWVPWLLHFAAYVVISGMMGGSLGKLAVGLRVVTPDGQLAGMGKHLLRTVLWVADAFTCAVPVLGGILMVTTRGHRRVGDMAASTFVIEKDRVGDPVVVPGLNAPWVPTPPPGEGLWGAQRGVAVPGQTTAPVSGDGPTWDEARGAYIQYDRERGAWLQWSESANEWRPIEQ